VPQKDRDDPYASAGDECPRNIMKRLIALTMLVVITALQGAREAGAQELEVRTHFLVPVGCPSATETHEYNKVRATVGTEAMGGCRTLAGHHFEIMRKTTLDGQTYVCARDENRGKCLWVLDR